MNEQIEILFKQAGGYVEVDNEGNYFTYTQDFDPDLFAKLIVQDCADFVDEAISDGGIDGRSLKKHFGVEE